MQTMLTIGAIAAAACYLLVRLRRTFSGKSPGCGQCAAGATDGSGLQAKPLVTIESLTTHRAEDRSDDPSEGQRR